MFTKEVGIDLGTANLLIYVKGEGIVIDEPSVVSIDAETKRCLAAGQEAKDMLGRTPGRVLAIRPLKDGVIADFEVCEIMLNYFLKKLNLKGMFKRPTILICCPSNITSVERNAIRDAAYRAGAKKVYIEEEPKVAAVGAGLDISKASGSMVLDIGGGTTDVAVLSLGEIVSSTSLKVAGDTLDRDIIKYVKEENVTPPRAVWLHFSVYEGIGTGGATLIPQDAHDIVAVDMGCVGELQTGSERKVTLCAKDSKGPYHYEFLKELAKVCIDHKVDYVVDTYFRYGSDVEGSLTAGYDARHITMGPGVYASHGYERTHISGLEQTFECIRRYLEQ